jgi:hypothetical protein
MAASVRTEVATAIPTFQVPSAAFFKFFKSCLCLSAEGLFLALGLLRRNDLRQFVGIVLGDPRLNKRFAEAKVRWKSAPAPLLEIVVTLPWMIC